MSLQIKPSSTPLHFTILGKPSQLSLAKAAAEMAHLPHDALPQLVANQRTAIAESVAWDVAASVYALLPLGCTGSQAADAARAAAHKKNKEAAAAKKEAGNSGTKGKNGKDTKKADSQKLHATNGDSHPIDKKKKKEKKEKA